MSCCSLYANYITDCTLFGWEITVLLSGSATNCTYSASLMTGTHEVHLFKVNLKCMGILVLAAEILSEARAFSLLLY